MTVISQTDRESDELCDAYLVDGKKLRALLAAWKSHLKANQADIGEVLEARFALHEAIVGVLSGADIRFTLDEAKGEKY